MSIGRLRCGDLSLFIKQFDFYINGLADGLKLIESANKNLINFHYFCFIDSFLLRLVKLISENQLTFSKAVGNERKLIVVLLYK